MPAFALCYQCYHHQFHQLGPDNSCCRTYQIHDDNLSGSQGKPLKPSKTQRGLFCLKRVLGCQEAGSSGKENGQDRGCEGG